MEYEIVKLSGLSGKGASVYSLSLTDEDKTLYEKFIEENLSLHESELIDINKRLYSIKDIGAKEHFFKKAEGILGDGVEALYDKPSSNLRLYCIRYGSSLIILGGGGVKPKNIRALQEAPKLKQENYLLRDLSKQITERLKEKDIYFTNDHKDLEGDLSFEITL